MTDVTILKSALKEKNMKQADLARIFGVNKATVSTNLRRDKMSLDTFGRYLNAMGYTIMVGEKNGDKFTPIWELEQEE